MLPFRKILCSTDFSEASYEALKAADELAIQFAAELYLVNVVAPIPVAPAVGTARPTATQKTNSRRPLVSLKCG
jgi:nucleotide-binding universal stress UspA family protein